jgi:hypothetical protein
MKRLIRKIWVRFLIKQIKKRAIDSESVARIIVHYTLEQMQKKGVSELEIEYTAPERTDVKLLILAYLTDKK